MVFTPESGSTDSAECETQGPGGLSVRSTAAGPRYVIGDRDSTIYIKRSDPGDETAPELSGAAVNGATLTLTFGEALDGGSVPPAGVFTVEVDGAARAVDTVTLTGDEATLTLASPVAADETVTVGYTPPAGPGATLLRDAAGNAVAGFSGRAVTNETPVPVNTAPTGLPAISGTALVGETLTASVQGIEDADGLIRAIFAYQWLSYDGTTDTEIQGATGASYTLVSADVGKTIKVRATFTDDGGTQESLVSEATAPVAAELAEVSITAVSSPVTEGAAAAFTLSRGGAAAAALTVAVEVSEAGAVLAGAAPAAVTFGAGASTATLTLATLDDGAGEADARVTAAVTAGAGYRVAAGAGTAVVDVFDNDAAPSAPSVITVWSADLAVADFGTDGGYGATSADGFSNAQGSAAVEMRWLWYWAPERTLYMALARPLADSAELTLHLGGVAVALADGGSGDSFTWRGVDLDWAGGETVAMRFSKEGDGAVETPFGAAVSVADAQVHEAADAVLAFRVRLNAAQTTAVSVRYATSDGTAAAGSDYVAGSGAVRFEPGVTERTVHVRVLEDAHDEGAETLTLALTNPSGATLEDGEATGTIADAGEPAPAVTPLTASVTEAPSAHTGSGTFTFRLLFSEPVGISYKTLRDESFTTTGGTVTGARRVDGRKDLWEIAVEPEGAEDVTITLAGGRACGTTGAVCTGEDTPRALTNSPSATVKGPSASEGDPPSDPLTASFSGVPGEHTGERFTFGLTFSEDVAGLSYKTLRDAAFSVTNGQVTRARRQTQGTNQGWTITVEPDSPAAVTVTLPAGTVETADGRGLESAVSATVQGPVGIAVADARVDEGAGATLAFAVTLDRAASGTVTVDYATADGTATAGADYTAASGTLTFQAGESSKTIAVAVLDDAHDEGEETLTLTLSNASGAWIQDGAATGTIQNSDPLPRAWLARFGRTVATHVTDAVSERLRGSPGQDSHLTVGGYRLPFGTRAAKADKPAAGERESALLQGVAGLLGLGSGQAAGTGTDPWGDRPAVDPRLGQSQSVNLDLRRLLLGSSFRLSLGATDDAGSSSPRLTAWGRVAGTTFDGRDGKVSLDGDVLTGTVGVDGEWDRLLAGLAVAHSRGDGSYTMPVAGGDDSGNLEQTLTSIHPYLRYAVNDRLDVWGLFGYGWGDLTMEQGTGTTYETDTMLAMGAFGGRGILLPAGETGGFELATRTDAMLTRTSSDAVAGMASADAEAHRLRLVLEGSRGFAWAEGRRLTPTMEVGLRHDWGDAETGFGLELGGRVQYADPALGLTIEAAVRGLLAHEDDDYQEWGASGSLRLAPGAGGRGLALTLAPTWGAASSGVDGLWSRQTTTGLAPQGNRQTPAGRLTAEIGYGVAAPFGTGLLTPYAGTVLSDGAARTYRVGGRLQLTGRGTTGLQVSLEGTRQEPAGQQPATQGLQFQVTWGF